TDFPYSIFDRFIAFRRWRTSARERWRPDVRLRIESGFWQFEPGDRFRRGWWLGFAGSRLLYEDRFEVRRNAREVRGTRRENAGAFRRFAHGRGGRSEDGNVDRNGSGQGVSDERRKARSVQSLSQGGDRQIQRDGAVFRVDTVSRHRRPAERPAGERHRAALL